MNRLGSITECLSEPVTPPPFTPSVIGMNDASKQAQMDFMQFLPIVIGGCVILLIVLIIICFAFKRRSSSRAGINTYFMLRAVQFSL